jgi:hypothetical protein
MSANILKTLYGPADDCGTFRTSTLELFQVYARRRTGSTARAKVR